MIRNAMLGPIKDRAMRDALQATCSGETVDLGTGDWIAAMSLSDADMTWLDE